MANSENFINIRTTEDLVNALSTLYFNLNEIERVYYDMFLNEKEMDVTFQRYDDKGVLSNITLPNRSKDKRGETITGEGSPEGKVSAPIGAHYLDTATTSLFYKCSGTGMNGWALIWSENNLQKGRDFLTPTSSAPQLKDLNASNVTAGTLPVAFGGTGAVKLSGLLKGNGSNPVTTAEDGVDFMGPSSSIGIINYYPIFTLVNGKIPDGIIPKGWLPCDGASYRITEYPRLYEALKLYEYNEDGTKKVDGEGSFIFTMPYGADIQLGTFNVPDLMSDGGYFIRSWNKTRGINIPEEDQIKEHSHTLESVRTSDESGHVHSKGSMNIVGRGCLWYTGNKDKDKSRVTGAFYVDETVEPNYRDVNNGATGDNSYPISFDASRDNAWTGYTSKGIRYQDGDIDPIPGSSHTHGISGGTDVVGAPQNTVLNKMMLPIIKY